MMITDRLLSLAAALEGTPLLWAQFVLCVLVTVAVIWFVAWMVKPSSGPQWDQESQKWHCPECGHYIPHSEVPEQYLHRKEDHKPAERREADTIANLGN